MEVKLLESLESEDKEAVDGVGRWGESPRLYMT